MQSLYEAKIRSRTILKEASSKFKSLILDYIAPKTFMLKARIPFRAVIVTGSMNSGKTSFSKALIARAVKQLLKNSIDENEITFIHSYERDISEIIDNVKNEIDFSKTKYLYLFNDDAAATSAFSTLRLKGTNIPEIQFYVMLRHRMEKLGFNGILIVFHATQVFNVIDKVFRTTSELYLFKSYPMDPNDIKLIGQLIGKAGMKALADITYKLRVLSDLDTFLEGVYTAVAKLIKSKRLVKAYEYTIDEINNYVKLLNKINYIIIEPKDVQIMTRNTPPPYRIQRVHSYG